MEGKALDEVLAALADPTRRGVVELLAEGPKRAGELAEGLGLTPPAMSRHLRILRLRGLVEEERGQEDARVRVFRLRREPFAGLSGWLQDVESYWTEQLDSFRARAERGRRS